MTTFAKKKKKILSSWGCEQRKLTKPMRNFKLKPNVRGRCQDSELYTWSTLVGLIRSCCEMLPQVKPCGRIKLKLAYNSMMNIKPVNIHEG